DKVEIKDTGRIGEVSVKSKSDKPVFIRGGTLLKGQGTQSRVVACGTIVMPEKEEVVKRGKVAVPVPVACVYSSHPISLGAGFDVVGKSHAPRIMMHYLRGPSTDQNALWGSVNNFASTARSKGVEEVSNDLIHTIEQVDRFKVDVEKIIDQVPAEENQVGMIVLDDKGVVGIEMFDHPGSWKALVKSIVKSYADVLGREDKDNIFEIKLERIIPMAQRFWEKLQTCKGGEVLFECNGAKTVSFKGDGIAGEYTVLNGEGIHAVATRVEDERETRVPRISIYNPANEPIRPVARWDYWPTGYERRPRYTTSRTVLSFLSSEPMKFTELFKKTPVSKPTLSRRLKNGVKDQLVAKTSEGYQLTAKGLYALREKENK
ncbi:unnamed protein product, partial [marine sediment metagenome]